jgi:DNA-binding GntR family transcriptional regulator
VTERGLALRLGVSATPVREALHRLEQECLVERVTARQLRIADQSVESLRELMHVEAAIRAVAARFATAKITAGTLDEMGELVAELERNPEQGDPEHQLSLARRFDELLLGAVGNDVVTGLIAPLSVFGWGLRVKAVQAMHADPEFGLSRIRAHRELLTALRARDADRVEALTRLQLTAAADYFMEWAQ